MLASILRNKAAALLIDRYGQGLTELFNNTISLISTATTLVIPLSVVRRLSYLYEKHGEAADEITDEIRVIRSWSVLTGLVGMVLVIITSPILSYITFGGIHFTRSYLFLSPMLVLLSINGTEVAILKATRRLRSLATASTIGSITTLVVSATSYYLWGLRGIVVSLNGSLFLVAILNSYYTIRAYPYRVAPFKWSVLKQGGALIKLSVSFLLASVVAVLAEMLIRTFISNAGSIEDVGLYGAGFALTVTYTKFIFSAMDADFYPRLSGLIDNIKEMNVAINRQVTVCVVLIVPFLLCFTLFLPLIIRIMYTHKYFEIIPMVTCATLFMFSKAVSTPVAYTSLAKGDSKMYLIIESVAAILLAGCVIGGYAVGGLMGAGIGLTLSNAIELIIIFVVYRRSYEVMLASSTVITIFTQFLLLVAGLVVISFVQQQILKYATVLALIAVTCTLAYRKFRSDKGEQ